MTSGAPRNDFAAPDRFLRDDPDAAYDEARLDGKIELRHEGDEQEAARQLAIIEGRVNPWFILDWEGGA